MKGFSEPDRGDPRMDALRHGRIVLEGTSFEWIKGEGRLEGRWSSTPSLFPQPSSRPVFIMLPSKAEIAHILTFASWFWTSLVACVAVFSSDMGQYARDPFITAFTAAIFTSAFCLIMPLCGVDDFDESIQSILVALLLFLSMVPKLNGIQETVAMTHHFSFDNVYQAHMVVQAFCWTCVSVGIEFALLVIHLWRTRRDPAARQVVVQFFACCCCCRDDRSHLQEEIPMGRTPEHPGASDHRTSPHTNIANA
ncbi:hypothetical protein EVG20_g2231 [Dentipellis fragilis]|uniref:Uncharacterized protein n=1 Tax=Dentipellis fragilis TaxID=205917 RepID=A0A4Y9Z9G7_9AGAM|nr:hypothetical protein EVG20_g2231 [Dentipellis fragilis]